MNRLCRHRMWPLSSVVGDPCIRSAEVAFCADAPLGSAASCSARALSHSEGEEIARLRTWHEAAASHYRGWASAVPTLSGRALLASRFVRGEGRRALTEATLEAFRLVALSLCR